MHTSPYAQTAPAVIETSNPVAASRELIEDWIVSRLSECAGIDPEDVDTELPCTAYGLDSLTGVTLVGDLELWLNMDLQPTLFWDLPSIDELVQYLVDELLTAPASLPEQEWHTGLRLDPETARQLLPHLHQLSDQDVEAMLHQLAA